MAPLPIAQMSLSPEKKLHIVTEDTTMERINICLMRALWRRVTNDGAQRVVIMQSNAVLHKALFSAAL